MNPKYLLSTIMMPYVKSLVMQSSYINNTMRGIGLRNIRKFSALRMPDFDKYYNKYRNKYNNKKEVTKIWNIVNSNNDFECAHLKIDGIFDGCIYNYIRSNFCSGD